MLKGFGRESGQAKVCCPMHLEANAVAPAFEKRKSFIEKSTGKETEGRSQICLLDLGLDSNFYELGRTAWYAEFAGRGGLCCRALNSFSSFFKTLCTGGPFMVLKIWKDRFQHPIFLDKIPPF